MCRVLWVHQGVRVPLCVKECCRNIKGVMRVSGVFCVVYVGSVSSFCFADPRVQ